MAALNGEDVGAVDDNCYSRIASELAMATYKIGGSYTFKMVYPGSRENMPFSDPTIVWSQTSNPSTTTDKVDDYTMLGNVGGEFWTTPHDSDGWCSFFTLYLRGVLWRGLAGGCW
jgi:hypothetical protein